MDYENKILLKQYYIVQINIFLSWIWTVLQRVEYLLIQFKIIDSSFSRKTTAFFLKKNKRGSKTYLQYMTLHLLLL